MAVYDPRFEFDPSTQNYHVIGPSSQQVAHDVMMAFNRDVEGKMRRALIGLGWCPPEVFAEFKAAFRANMLRHCGDGADAEIDRVLKQFDDMIKPKA